MSDVELHYRISGNGSPVIFLHGFMENLQMWNEVLEDFPCRSVCVDLNGHGESQLTEHSVPSITFMAEQVGEIIRKEKLENAIIVGHSMGGYVGLELMKRFPTLEHLILFHSHPWEDSVEKKQDRERVAELIQSKASIFIRDAIPNLFFDPQKNMHAIAKYIHMAEQMSPQAIAWAARAMKNRINNEQQLIENPSKYCFVIGEKDQLIPSKQVESFCSKNAIPVVVIKDVGHMAHEEKLRETKSILQTILLEN